MVEVKYEGQCVRCGLTLAVGASAVYDRPTRTMHCIECPQEGAESIDYGEAGRSAQQEYERRLARDHEQTTQRWGKRVGGLVIALSEERQSTRSWSDVDWPLFGPDAFRGVRLEGLRSIKKLVAKDDALDHPPIEHLTRLLAAAFPAR